MIVEQSVEALSDQTLLNQLSLLVSEDRQRTARLLRVIDAIDRRQLWARLRHPSLFDFLVRRCHMSESTAGKRIGAARSARRFPVIFEMVARGELHLSGIHRLKAHLTPENHALVLARAKHATIRHIEHLVAELAPRGDAPSSLRVLPRHEAAVEAPSSDTTPATAAAQATKLAQRAEAAEPSEAPIPVVSSAAPKPRPHRTSDPSPLSPGRYQLRVTLDQAAHDRLAELQDLLAHQIPNGDPAIIVARALEALLREVKKQKIGLSDRPRASKAPPRRSSERGSRTIPARLRREVWDRDAGRCSFVGEDGCVCGATRALEFAHMKPWGKGGEHSIDNLALRCPAHNAYEAVRDYGEDFMRKKQRERSVLRVREPLASYRILQSHQKHPYRHTPHGAHHPPAKQSPAPRALWSCGRCGRAGAVVVRALWSCGRCGREGAGRWVAVVEVVVPVPKGQIEVARSGPERRRLPLNRGERRR